MTHNTVQLALNSSVKINIDCNGNGFGLSCPSKTCGFKIGIDRCTLAKEIERRLKKFDVPTLFEDDGVISHEEHGTLYFDFYDPCHNCRGISTKCSRHGHPTDKCPKMIEFCSIVRKTPEK